METGVPFFRFPPEISPSARRGAFRLFVGLTLLVFFTGCAGMPAPACNGLSGAGKTGRAEILALFDQWDRSLASGDPRAVVANYAPDAVLLPTVSNKPRLTQAERADYFEHFLKSGPRGKIDEAHIRTDGKTAINSGLYTFTFRDGSTVRARFTFVYEKRADGKWYIVEHHSSKFPGQP